jgi:hypothetical protein
MVRWHAGAKHEHVKALPTDRLFASQIFSESDCLTAVQSCETPIAINSRIVGDSELKIRIRGRYVIRCCDEIVIDLCS